MKNSKANIFVKGKGVPIVLLHSSMSSKLQWYGLMESLHRQYLVILVDLYGYGDSPFPDNKENFCLNDEITLVESLLADIIPPDEPFHLVGHSYGGAVGLRFCYKELEQARATPRILSLALFEPVAFHLLPENDEIWDQVSRQKEIILSFMLNKQYSAAAEYFIDYWSGAGTFAGFPAMIRQTFLQAIHKLPLDFRALVGEPLSLEDYSKIKQPVCLMAGRQSPLMAQRVSVLLAEKLPNCRLEWIDGGHMAPVYRAEEVNAVIKTFIRGVPPPFPRRRGE
jgi:pimeloyl-ACP methyl ester carboxylesterase